MASKDKEVAADEEAPAKPANGKKKALFKWAGIVLGVLALIAVSVGASIYVVKSMSSGASATSEDGQGGDGGGDAKGKSDKGKKKEPKIAIYHKLDAPFVVNFQGQSGNRFLQVTMELMTYSQETIAALEQNMPVIKNNIVFLLSSVTYDQVSTVEGKQKLRADTLAEIQKILKEKTGKPGVEEVYFTSIVMQ